MKRGAARAAALPRRLGGHRGPPRGRRARRQAPRQARLLHGPAAAGCGVDAPPRRGGPDTLDDPAQLAEIQARLRAGKAKPTDKVTFSILGASPPTRSTRTSGTTGGAGSAATLGATRPLGGPRARRRSAGPLPRQRRARRAGRPPTPRSPVSRTSAASRWATSLASFKQESFCSYGFDAGRQRPGLRGERREYRAALNQLLREHGQKFGPAKVVPWFKDE